MGKRKWTDIKMLEAGIIAMREAGKTRKEIAEYYGLAKGQIKNWVNRYNRTQAKLAAGITPRRRGRPQKNEESVDIVVEQAYEIKRLRMENELLRDFLHFTERE